MNPLTTESVDEDDPDLLPAQPTKGTNLMNSSPKDDKRLQALFQMIGGTESAHEIATAVQKIKDHLDQTGRTFGDLTVTTNATSATALPTFDRDEVEDALRRSQEILRRHVEPVDRGRGVDTGGRMAQRRQSRAEIQRDVLATFVSERVLELAMLQADSIIARIEKGEDVATSFGRPGWKAKAGPRPDRRWGV